MSIDKVRKLTESRGCCGIATICLMALGALMFIVPSTCGRNFGKLSQQENRLVNVPQVVAKIGAYSISSESIAAASKAQNPNGGGDPLQEVQAMGQVLQGFITEGVVYDVAVKKGITFSDADLEKSVADQLDQAIMQQRFSLMIGNKLKPNATDADFEAAFRAQAGVDTKTWRQQTLDGIRPKLKDPVERIRFAAAVARQVMEVKAALVLSPTDDEVKRQNNQLTFKRIFVRPLPGAAGDSAARAKKALAEINGGLSFEGAMNRYSNDAPPSPGKSVSEGTQVLGVVALVSDTARKDLLKLKAGEMSAVLPVDGGAAIYKLVSVKGNPLPDFAKNKGELRKAYAAHMAQATVASEIAAAIKQAQIEWKGQGHKAVYDFYVAQNLPTSEMTKKLVEIEKSAAAVSGNNEEERAATLARYACSTMLWARYSSQEKKAGRADRIDALNGALRNSESINVHLELVDLFAEDKNGKDAADHLLSAASDNNDLDPTGQQYFGLINAKVEKLKSQGLLKPDPEKLIQDQLNRWRSDKAEKEKSDDARRKLDVEDRQRAEAEKKKADDDAKKAAAASKIDPKKSGK